MSHLTWNDTPYTISIPMDGGPDERASKYMEVADWIGEQGLSGQYMMHTARFTDNSYRLIVGFKEADPAMLFKLRWV